MTHKNTLTHRHKNTYVPLVFMSSEPLHHILTLFAIELISLHYASLLSSPNSKLFRFFPGSSGGASTCTCLRAHAVKPSSPFPLFYSFLWIKPVLSWIHLPCSSESSGLIRRKWFLQLPALKWGGLVCSGKVHFIIRRGSADWTDTFVLESTQRRR